MLLAVEDWINKKTISAVINISFHTLLITAAFCCFPRRNQQPQLTTINYHNRADHFKRELFSLNGKLSVPFVTYCQFCESPFNRMIVRRLPVPSHLGYARHSQVDFRLLQISKRPESRTVKARPGELFIQLNLIDIWQALTVNTFINMKDNSNQGRSTLTETASGTYYARQKVFTQSNWEGKMNINWKFSITGQQIGNMAGYQREEDAIQGRNNLCLLLTTLNSNCERVVRVYQRTEGRLRHEENRWTWLLSVHQQANLTCIWGAGHKDGSKLLSALYNSPRQPRGINMKHPHVSNSWQYLCALQ